jgi:hypothetical protein
VCRFHAGLSEYREDELSGYLMSMSIPPKVFGSSGQKTLCIGVPKPCRQDGGSKNCSGTTVSALVYMGRKEGLTMLTMLDWPHESLILCKHIDTSQMYL